MTYDHVAYDDGTKSEHLWVYRPYVGAREQFPLLIQCAGYARWQEGVEFSRIDSATMWIEYVQAGNVCLSQNGQEHVVQAGEVYVLRKGCNHRYVTGPSGIVLKRFVCLDGVALDYYLQTLGLWTRDHLFLQDPKPFQCLLKGITRLISNSSENDPRLDIQQSCFAYQMLLELGRAQHPIVPPIMEQALTYMHENLHRPLARHDICRHVGISTSHFNRLFTEYMDCSPMAYFARQKYSWAAQLLQTTALSIKEVAYKAGFEDPLYFSSQFKKHFGLSPRAYRKIESESSS